MQDLFDPIFKLKHLVTLELSMQPRNFDSQEEMLEDQGCRIKRHGIPRDLPAGGYEALREKVAAEQKVTQIRRKSRLAAARFLVDNMPSLRKGWFWDELMLDHSNCGKREWGCEHWAFARSGWETKETIAGGREVVLDDYEVILDFRLVNEGS